MLGHELAVEQGEISNLEARDQPGERYFRGVGLPAEHTLAEESAAELHPVKPADEAIAGPHLDRMGVPRRVERDHRLLELGVDPRLLPVGAGGDDRSEVAVARDFEPAGTKRPLERT